MKKILKRVAQIVGALLVLGILAMVVKFYGLSPKMRPAQAMTAPITPEAIARGKYLVTNVAGCTGCHSPIDDTKPGDPPIEGKVGSGRDFGDWGPDVPFHLRAPNLTPDKETGLGNWTDGEIVRAMREGVSRDGRTLFAQMPFQTYAKTLSDDDALAIVAYLRTLPPIKNDPGLTTVKFPVSMFMRAAPQPLAAPPPPAPSPSDKLARGKWLLDACSCHDCHDSFDNHHQPIAGKAFGGNFVMPVPGKGSVVAPNISSDKATGIGAYSDEDLHRVFDEGKGKAGRFLYVMPWSYYSGMTKDDKDALIAALREAPPVSNVVAPSQLK